MFSPHPFYRRVARLGIATATLGAAACGDNTIGAPTFDPNDPSTALGVNATQRTTFITVDVPGSTQTRVLDLNEPGELVGFYNIAGVQHGFIRGKDEVFVTIDPPNSTATFPHGINNRGDITGRFIEAGTNRTRGFLLAGGAYTVFDFPGRTISSRSSLMSGETLPASTATRPGFSTGSC